MAFCEHCGNDYVKSFQVVMRGKTHTFDSFECAIHTLAPLCARCKVRIVGQGRKKTAHFSAVITAPKRKACADCATGFSLVPGTKLPATSSAVSLTTPL